MVRERRPFDFPAAIFSGGQRAAVPSQKKIHSIPGVTWCSSSYEIP